MLFRELPVWIRIRKVVARQHLLDICNSFRNLIQGVCQLFNSGLCVCRCVVWWCAHVCMKCGSTLWWKHVDRRFGAGRWVLCASPGIPSVPTLSLSNSVPSLVDASFSTVLLGKLTFKCGLLEGTQNKNKGKALRKSGGVALMWVSWGNLGKRKPVSVNSYRLAGTSVCLSFARTHTLFVVVVVCVCGLYGTRLAGQAWTLLDLGQNTVWRNHQVSPPL